MSIVGHPKVTERAYEQDRELLDQAARFAEAAIHNGLGPRHELTTAQVSRLMAQIERDFLVAISPSKED